MSLILNFLLRHPEPAGEGSRELAKGITGFFHCCVRMTLYVLFKNYVIENLIEIRN